MRWTTEQDDLLRQYVGQGLSSTQIAPLISPDTTRNSVIGRALRLGIQLRGNGGGPRRRRGWEAPARAENIVSASRPAPKPKRAAEPEQPAYLSVIEATDLPPDESPFACTLIEIEKHQCRFPLGDPSTPEFRFCGAQKFETHSYCARHCRVSYQAPQQRQVRTTPRKSWRA